MENLRRRIDVKLVRSNEEDKLRRLIASPAFAQANIFDDDLAAIQVHKSPLELNHPLFVGMSILDLSVHLMYDFYYNQLQGQYGDRCQLLYTDTDSLLLKVQTEDVLRDMASHTELYDTSDYPPEHPLHSIANKKVLGKMKEVSAGPEGETSRRQRVWKRMSWKSTSDLSSTKRLSSESEPSAIAWTSCGQSAIASTCSAWIRSQSHLLLQALDRRKLGGHAGLWAQRRPSSWRCWDGCVHRWTAQCLRTPSGGSWVSGGTTRSSSLTKPRGGPSCK